MAVNFLTTISNAFSWIKNIEISIEILLKFVSKGPTNNIPALVQIMAWRQATSHYLSQWWLIYWCIYASLALNEFIMPVLLYVLCDNKLLPSDGVYVVAATGSRWMTFYLTHLKPQCYDCTCHISDEDCFEALKHKKVLLYTCIRTANYCVQVFRKSYHDSTYREISRSIDRVYFFMIITLTLSL